jgi:hypothetical protein
MIVSFFANTQPGSYCRWTKYMSTESGGNSDNELIANLGPTL